MKHEKGTMKMKGAGKNWLLRITPHDSVEYLSKLRKNMNKEEFLSKEKDEKQAKKAKHKFKIRKRTLAYAMI